MRQVERLSANASPARASRGQQITRKGACGYQADAYQNAKQSQLLYDARVIQSDLRWNGIETQARRGALVNDRQKQSTGRHQRLCDAAQPALQQTTRVDAVFADE